MTKRASLFCFSPPVMLGTFGLELMLAVYVLWRFRYSLQRNIVVLLLICLAVFQKAEFVVCVGEANTLWTRLGLAVITLLPPLGIHLINTVTGRRVTTWISYFLAIPFLAAIVTIPSYAIGSTCGGNYVLFQAVPSYSFLYGLYYIGLLGLGVVDALHFVVSEANRHERAVMGWLIGGYLSFMLPMGVVYVVSEQARHAVPSIMCGFALILAIILALRVMPLLQHQPEDQ